MKRALFALMAVAFAVPAFAADNPDIVLGLDAEPPMHVSYIEPAAYEEFNVYVVLSCFGGGGGTRGVGILFDRTFAAVKTGQTNLLGGLDMGDVEQDGWSLVAGAECVYPAPETNYVVAGYVSYLFLGGPGTITVLPHPVSGREVLDCNDIPDYFCVYSNFGVLEPAPEPEADCFFCEPSPVEDASWGAIKSLYR